MSSPAGRKGLRSPSQTRGTGQLTNSQLTLSFVIDEKPHELYKRDGNNLTIQQKITLVEALSGTVMNLRTLDGRDLAVSVTDVVSPGYELVIAREGMPIAKEPGTKGNLRIKFDVKFPARLTVDQRAAIRRILGG